MKPETLKEHLLAQGRNGLISSEALEAARSTFPVDRFEAEEAALRAGLLPIRYLRNRRSLSLADQLRLHRSRVAVIGCGGLGGHASETLARIGCGSLTLCDPDVFEEHNLNRQPHSSPGNLGQLKVEVTRDRIGEVNPAVRVKAVPSALEPENAGELLEGADLVVDALDNPGSRVQLARICSELSLPMVHGAVGGWCGRIAVQFPGEDLTPVLIGRQTGDRGIEGAEGVPGFAPQVIAGLQAAAACSILIGRPAALRRRLLYMDLLDMEAAEVPW